MRLSTRILLPVVLSAATLGTAPAALAESDWGPGYRDCGSFKAEYTINVAAKKLPCSKAMAIQREYWLGPKSRKVIVNGGSGYRGYTKLKRYPGWKCSSGAGAGACTKGGSQAVYDN